MVLLVTWRVYALRMRALLVGLVLVVGCGAPPVVPRAEDPADAERIASEAATKAQCGPPEHREVAINRVNTETWAVHFEHVPPVPPGGRCVVHVRIADGSTKLFRLE
jgi:hypothetical protein